MLSGSVSHEDETESATYEHIVSIATTLVRQRRDLVATALPHLSAILSRLLEILRAVRPDLGARQRRSVTDTLPTWINSSYPLGADNAKSLARLLTSLMTKYTVRSAPSRIDSAGKAQSLAQPFSKHAPYVLTAYLRALTDPLSQFSPPIRGELEPGLFALCDMMGEHGRDSIMTAMLDDGGRTMLKILWKEYDKQRDTGKG
jgi:Urb2/Npa2 family